MNQDTLKGIFQVLNIAENLKTEMRHSWLSDGRQESVAEHTWRMALMVMLVEPHLDQKVDLLKCIKLALVHDLGEAKAGDVCVFDVKTAQDEKEKFEAEEKGMQEICSHLPPEAGKELYDLWLEYEECQTYEARFVKALDKLEVHLQHNEADISTWNEIEYLMWFQSKWMANHCAFDSALKAMSDFIRDEALEKMEKAGKNLDQLRKDAA